MKMKEHVKKIMKKGRVRIVALLVGALAMTAFSGCAGTPKEPNTKDEANVGQTDNKEKNENVETMVVDELTAGVTYMPSSLTPFRNMAANNIVLFRYLYDRLAYYNAGSYIPQAAKSYECAEDGVTWSVEIYDTIYDSAGNHITADDIVWFMEEYMKNGLKPCFGKIQVVEKTGDYTFQVTMREDVSGQFEACLSHTYIISRKAYEESENGFADQVVSTSPYVVKEFVPDASIVLELRDDYWRVAENVEPILATNVKKLTLRKISEASQMQVALETHEVDAFLGIASTVVGSFINNEFYQVVNAPYVGNLNLWFSGAESKAISKDVNLRKAICHAFDAQGAITVVYAGYGEEAHEIIPRMGMGYLEQWTDEEYWLYDLEQAKEYLEASDYKGEELSLLTSPSNQQACTILQAYLEAVGIKVRLDVRDQALFSASAFDGNNYDLMVASGSDNIVDMWAQFLDSDAYEHGDAMARTDDVLTGMIHDTWKTENFTEENIEEIHEYLMENCYCRGLMMKQMLSVVSEEYEVADEMIDSCGLLDMAASTYVKR